MSQLFDKYVDEYVDIPNNQLCFLPRKKEFKDLLVLGADNQHTFQLPYAFDEIKYMQIRYIQGTEVKLIKEFDMSRFYPENTSDEIFDDEDIVESTEGVKSYVYFDRSAKLFELDKKMVLDQLESHFSIDEDIDTTYCVLYYSVSPEDTKLFNDFNKNIFVQLQMKVDIKQDSITYEKTDFSKEFKLKLVTNIFDNERVVEEAN